MAKYENIHFEEGQRNVTRIGDKQISRPDIKRVNSVSYSRGKSNVGSLLIIVFSLILLVCLFRALTNSTGTLTFTGFLERLSSFSAPFPDLRILDNTIKNSWGIFDGLRDFINIFIQLFDFTLFLAKSMTNIASYVFDMIKFFFGF